MSASTGGGSGNGHRAKAQSVSGWTAFDLKQRRKQQGLEAAADNHDSDHYPSLSGNLTQPQTLFNTNGSLLHKHKPFASVVVPSMKTASFKDKSLPSQLPASTSSSLGTKCSNVDTMKAYGKLKDLHPWADESLIHDVLAGVNNNVHDALSLLEAMAVSEDEVDEKDKGDSSCNDISFWLKEDTISFINESLDENHKPSEDEESSMRLLDTIKSLPIESEPEWGEDDVYLIYRKDAIRMTRSASHHSKSANDAYVRGDHAAARHFSLKAQQEWAAAERLNAKAANDILNVRNCRNNIWTLDLHGLHAAEAVEALRERLKRVESPISQNGLAASGMSVVVPVQSTSHLGIENFGKQHPTSRPRTTLLEVITGKGNHSRGSAALPSAIRSFLSENRYHFDETRPGVIMVRPKYRLQ